MNIKCESARVLFTIPRSSSRFYLLFSLKKIFGGFSDESFDELGTTLLFFYDFFTPIKVGDDRGQQQPKTAQKGCYKLKERREELEKEEKKRQRNKRMDKRIHNSNNNNNSLYII